MNIETRKLELIHLLLQTQNESILKKLKSVFEEEEQVDWWHEMSNTEQEEIKTGIKQADNREYKANKAVMTRFDN